MPLTRRFPHMVALVAFLALAAACDEEDGGTGPGEDVYGVWELDEEETLYLDIQPEQITRYLDTGDCFEVMAIPVVDREGDVFTLDVGGTEEVAHIQRQGDGLIIELDDDPATYTWAGDVNLDALTEC